MGAGHTSYNVTEEHEQSLAAQSRKHCTLESLVENNFELPVHLWNGAPRILSGKNLFHVALVKALSSWQRRDLALPILHPQGIAQNLAQSSCSINVCWMRKLLAGRAVN